MKFFYTEHYVNIASHFSAVVGLLLAEKIKNEL